MSPRTRLYPLLSKVGYPQWHSKKQTLKDKILWGLFLFYRAQHLEITGVRALKIPILWGKSRLQITLKQGCFHLGLRIEIFAKNRINSFAKRHKTLEKALFYWGFGSVQGALTTLRFKPHNSTLNINALLLTAEHFLSVLKFSLLSLRYHHSTGTMNFVYDTAYWQCCWWRGDPADFLLISDIFVNFFHLQ